MKSPEKETSPSVSPRASPRSLSKQQKKKIRDKKKKYLTNLASQINDISQDKSDEIAKEWFDLC